MITKEQEYKTFVFNWQKKPANEQPQVIDEVASYIQESSHHVDYYFYDFNKNGEFLIPTNGKKVKDEVKKWQCLGETEWKVVDIEEHQRKNGEKVFFWVSPQHEGVYPDLKVTISEVIFSQGRQRLLNRAILFNYDEVKSWQLVQDLIAESKNRPLLSTLEEVRGMPLIFDSQKDWIDLLVKVTQNSELGKIIRTGEDERLQQEAILKADRFYDEILGTPTVELNAKDYHKYGFGDYLSSCPILSEPYKGLNYWNRGDCRSCLMVNTEVGPCKVCKMCEARDNLTRSMYNIAA